MSENPHPFAPLFHFKRVSVDFLTVSLACGWALLSFPRLPRAQEQNLTTYHKLHHANDRMRILPSSLLSTCFSHRLLCLENVLPSLL